jgi:hypothetical protein
MFQFEVNPARLRKSPTGQDGDLTEIALRQFEFDSAKVLIQVVQSSLVALGIGATHGFCANCEANATPSGHQSSPRMPMP